MDTAPHVPQRIALILVGCLCAGLSRADDPHGNREGPVIAGASVTEWRERISELDLQDPASTRYVPGLIELMNSPNVPWFTRRQAALTLGRLGSLATEAVPHLKRWLNDTGDDVTTSPRLWSIKALGLFGPLAATAAPELVDIYHQQETSHLARLSILETLSQIGPAHPAAIPQLLSVAGDVESAEFHRVERRQAAIEALGMVGPAASVAIPVLARALDDADPITRRLASETLMRIGPASEIVAAQLFEHMVTDDSVEVQDAAENALQAIGPSLGPMLNEWLTSEQAVVRSRVARIFGQWGTMARPWARGLHALWADPDPAVQLTALEASRRVEGASAELAVRSVALFTSDDRQLRRRAYLLFRRCEEYQAAAHDDLERFRQHPQAYVRDLAERALGDE